MGEGEARPVAGGEGGGVSEQKGNLCGTWSVSRHGYESPYMAHAFIEDENGAAVCGVWCPDGNAEQADRARLLAAAPKLLESARLALDELYALVAYGESTWEATGALEDAIAEATGGDVSVASSMEQRRSR